MSESENKTVMIVDDTSFMRVMLKNLLEKLPARKVFI